MCLGRPSAPVIAPSPAPPPLAREARSANEDMAREARVRDERQRRARTGPSANVHTDTRGLGGGAITARSLLTGGNTLLGGGRGVG